MKRVSIVIGLLLLFSSWAVAGEVSVVNPKAAFPEGPMWHQGKLFYVEYGGHTLMTWDGTSNEEFWKMDGCGPSAVTTNADGDFLITCYDSNQMTGEFCTAQSQRPAG